MLGVFAEFRTNLRRERQLEGIADAKARGVYRGRKASIDPGKVQALKAQGMGPSAIAGSQNRSCVCLPRLGELKAALAFFWEVRRSAIGDRQPICHLYRDGITGSYNMPEVERAAADSRSSSLDANGGHCQSPRPVPTKSVRACFPGGPLKLRAR
jgi:hypothetical protein